MGMTDPLADMLTRIRNGVKARFTQVDIPASNVKIDVARVLKDEGFIKNYKVIKDDKQGILRVYLKYGPSQTPVIYGIERVSRPGRRVYLKAKDVKPVLHGMGSAILTTSQGVMTDREARIKNVGGEVICKVW
ncbi:MULTISPECIES: 30S ribosomal protein S8 [Desulfatibacillum]|jgi:small subunit ribosomal protein S8|uniref:Small ribosomal subunit protein uS8 n=2 Tax=Desulfatibacillum TaxID=218207 RepID=B8FES1_DESAL|nr:MULTISPECIES: 30S ribosomal protein S8 [Desulfatibacillum]ACL03598.1 ribosomal protein S8 [Desulfatibacillum aliphaticivorans]SHK91846.1 SSU ribosomal protein S8P [Desulfatibacillum alkenivorans DSM 16219]